MAKVASQDRHDVITALTMQAVNESIDIAAEQQAARRNHVPTTLIVLLFVSTAMASVFLGYSTSELDVRNVPIWIAFAVVVSLVMFTILDLDRPRRGVIRVHADALLETRATFVEVDRALGVDAPASSPDDVRR